MNFIVCHRWQFATGVVDTGGKFAAGIVDTGGKFATGINNTTKTCSKICRRCRWHRWSTFSCEYLREFSKKFEMALMVYSRAWGKLIHEKNQKQKISWHCPFNEVLLLLFFYIFYKIVIISNIHLMILGTCLVCYMVCWWRCWPQPVALSSLISSLRYSTYMKVRGARDFLVLIFSSFSCINWIWCPVSRGGRSAYEFR